MSFVIKILPVWLSPLNETLLLMRFPKALMNAGKMLFAPAIEISHKF